MEGYESRIGEMAIAGYVYVMSVVIQIIMVV